MMKMVRKHLSEKYVVQEEDLLERIAESSEKGMLCLVKGCQVSCLFSLDISAVIQMRKNPPSPLHKGKRKSGHEKFSKLPLLLECSWFICSPPLSLSLRTNRLFYFSLFNNCLLWVW